MKEADLIAIIFRKGPTGGREEAARTAELCGGKLAELAPLIRSGNYPPVNKPTDLQQEPVQKPRLTARMIDEVIARDGHDAAADLAESAGWNPGTVAKIRERRWNPNSKPGDGAGVDQNNGRFSSPPKFLRKPARFNGAAARERAEQLSCEKAKKNGRPRTRPERWDSNVEKRRAHV